MASATVVSAITAMLTGAWTATPIILPNTSASTLDDGSAFVTLEFPVAVERKFDMNFPSDANYEEEGAFRLVLAVPRGSGLDQAQAWMDALKTIFRGQRFAVRGLCAGSITGPNFDDDATDGAYVKLSIAVAYVLFTGG